MATRGERIYGPYPHRSRWRVVVVDGDGRRTAQTFASAAEAEGVAEAARLQLAGRQVSDAVDAYLDDCRRRELRTDRRDFAAEAEAEARDLSIYLAAEVCKRRRLEPHDR